MILVHDHWFWNLFFVVCCILDGFGYPLVLKSWFSLLFWYSRWFWLPIGSEILVFLLLLVFSMVFVTHWFWNLGFLGFVGILDGFGYPLVLKSWFSWFVLVFSMVLAIPYIISAVRFLRFPRGCLTECSLHAGAPWMSSGMSKLNEPCMLTARRIIPNMTMCPVQADVAWIVACLAHAANVVLWCVHDKYDMLNYVQCVGACYVWCLKYIVRRVCCVVYVMLLHCVAYGMLRYVTYYGKSCHVMLW